MRRKGFTLMEVLIATALVGLVLGLALKGFARMQAMAALARSRATADHEASYAVSRIAALLKRCDIIYFNVRPLDQTPSSAFSGGGILPVDYLPPAPTAMHWPSQLFTLAAGTQKVLYPFGQPTQPYPSGVSNPPTAPSGFYSLHSVSDFRFFAGTDAAKLGAGLTSRLTSNDPVATAAGASDFDKYFPSPLLYCAEAIFDTHAPAGAAPDTSTRAPIGWNFYVLYLAPMELSGPNDPLAPEPIPTGLGLTLANIWSKHGFDRIKRDLGGASTPGTAWMRSTVPFELRLLTIPVVRAAKKDFSTSADTDPSSTPWGGALDTDGVPKAAPYDYDPSLPAPRVNYDPIPITMADHAYDFLTIASTNTPPYTACGPRVLGTAEHQNYGNLGDDPPTGDVFNNLLGTPPAGVTPTVPRDEVLARYVDPDNIHGTCVCLENMTMEGTHPYVNAYDTSPQWFSPGAYPQRGLLYRQDAGYPRHALVSVTTRYRTNLAIPFQFSTSSEEVDLSALESYQSTDRTVQ